MTAKTKSSKFIGALAADSCVSDVMSLNGRPLAAVSADATGGCDGNW